MIVPFEWQGEQYEVECLDDWLSKWTTQGIVKGETYPLVPDLAGVETVVDVGANCGVASVLFSLAYPGATIHALEPAALPFAVLTRNAERFARIHPEQIGLYSEDRDDVPLYQGVHGTGQASIHESEHTTGESQSITLRGARAWLDSAGIDRIDVLKVDTEGCEVPILRDLEPVLADVKVIYLEYHSEDDRRTIDRLLEPTHLMLYCKGLFGTGEVTYVARPLVDAVTASAAPTGFVP